MRHIFAALSIQTVRGLASERLELIEHEEALRSSIAADFLSSKTIADADWQRLAQAVGRIGNARHG